MTTSKTHIYDLCMIALCTALIAVMAQISIPMPLGVPMTMQTFAITLAAVVLGSKKGAVSALIYVLLGMIGIPVFSNFTGGIQYLAGPTGGFLISFPIMAYLIGLGSDKWKNFRGGFPAALILGTTVNYIVGTVMYCILTDSTVLAGVAACVIPFLPTAVLKAVLASALGLQIRRRIGVMIPKTL